MVNSKVNVRERKASNLIIHSNNYISYRKLRYCIFEGFVINIVFILKEIYYKFIVFHINKNL